MTPLTNTDRPLIPGDGDEFATKTTICTQVAIGIDSDRMQVNPMEVNSQELNYAIITMLLKHPVTFVYSK